LGNLPTIIQWVAGVFFVTIISYAVISDIRRLIIPNQVSLSLVIIFLPAALAAGLMWSDIAIHIGIGLAVFVVGIILFALGLIGGGDVKLMSAISIWFGWPEVYGFLLLFAILGGILAVVVMILRKAKRLPGPLAALPWLNVGESKDAAPGMPYGIAIGIAALLLMPQHSILVTVFRDFF